MLFEAFKHGINLGGYLSQYELIADAGSQDSLKEHFETFITKEDIGQIAGWGLDHVRIPVDGYLFFDRKKKVLRKDPLAYLDRCMEWCAEYGLNVVIDLHNITGHVSGQMDAPTPLMVEEDLRSDFCLFWGNMAKHFKGYGKVTLLFELFNEIADATGYQWNKLYKSAIKAIREVDLKRWILAGSNYVNSVGYLDRLDLVEDPYVFYNFHYYEPNVFTHQMAHFSEEFRTFKKTLSYPGDMGEYIEFVKTHHKFRKEHPMIMADLAEDGAFGNGSFINDRKLMEKYLADAKRFVEYSGCELYCGEFGVIDCAPEEEAVKWLGDFITICNEIGIGHAMWNYKCLDFEILDREGNVVRPKVLALLKEFR